MIEIIDTYKKLFDFEKRIEKEEEGYEVFLSKNEKSFDIYSYKNNERINIYKFSYSIADVEKRYNVNLKILKEL